MGLLVEGQWVDRWYDTEKTKGEFVRQSSPFRNWITSEGPFKPAKNRYHLYVSYACPWAHRTLIFRALKGLDSMISVSVVNPYMGETGWCFKPYPGSTEDHLFHVDNLYEIYLKADLNFTGRVTVPILWDKETNTIVNNESSEIIRMFNSAFDHLGAKPGDYYPKTLGDKIDHVNEKVYTQINNGVYRCGFATSQKAYETAYDQLFDALDWVDDILSGQDYLVEEGLTEADWRLFTTLVRFDAVYYSHFKCNKRRICDYKAISPYLIRLYNHPGVKETVHMDHIKTHYYASHKTINPTGIVPKSPEIPWL